MLECLGIRTDLTELCKYSRTGFINLTDQDHIMSFTSTASPLQKEGQRTKLIMNSLQRVMILLYQSNPTRLIHFVQGLWLTVFCQRRADFKSKCNKSSFQFQIFTVQTPSAPTLSAILMDMQYIFKVKFIYSFLHSLAWAQNLRDF